MATLIIEAGGSKTNFWYISPDGIAYELLKTEGFNPINHSFNVLSEYIELVLNQALISPESIDTVYYYGAGVNEYTTNNLKEQVFQALFGKAHVDLQSDLIAACRATSYGKASIVCILGTGSNVCHFDGYQIVKKIPSVGRILGDPGSGIELGKRLLKVLLFSAETEFLRDGFTEFTGLTPEEFHQLLLRSKDPYKELAYLSYFAELYKDNATIQSCLEDHFKEISSLIIAQLDQKIMNTINFVGGFAKAFELEITQHFQMKGWNVQRIVDNPAPLLIEYHIEKTREIQYE